MTHHWCHPCLPHAPSCTAVLSVTDICPDALPLKKRNMTKIWSWMYFSHPSCEQKKILSDNAIMLEPPTWSNGSPWRPFLYRYKNNFRKRNAYRDPNTLTRKSGHGTSLSIELALNSQDLPKHLACPTFGGRWNQMVSSFLNLHGSLRFEATALWLQVLLLGWWCHLSHPSLLVASSKEMGSVDRTDGKVLFECYLTKQLS